MTTDKSKLINEITKKLVDEGKLIEAGWQLMLICVLPPDASDIQKSEMRKAFFAGAQHLLASILGFLDPDSEPTEKDMARMMQIHSEITEFYNNLRSEYLV